MTPEEYLNTYTELTPELARELRLEKGKSYEGIDDSCQFVGHREFDIERRITNRLRIQQHPLLALVWDGLHAKSCTLKHVHAKGIEQWTELTIEHGFGKLTKIELCGNPLDIPEGMTITIERGEG